MMRICRIKSVVSELRKAHCHFTDSLSSSLDQAWFLGASYQLVCEAKFELGQNVRYVGNVAANFASVSDVRKLLFN